MKKFSFIFLLLFTDSFIHAQGDGEKLVTQCYSYVYNNAGKIISTISEEEGKNYIFKYDYDSSETHAAIREYDSNGNIISNTIETYDASGHLLLSKHINEAFSSDTIKRYCSWNKYGLITSDSSTDSKKGLTEAFAYKYKDTTLLEISVYYPVLKDTNTTRYSFDADGHRIIAETINSKRGLSQIDKYDYNKKGFVVSEFMIFDQQQSNKAFEKIHYEYSKSGKLIHEYSEDKTNDIDFVDAVFTYDKSGKLVRCCSKSYEEL